MKSQIIHLTYDQALDLVDRIASIDYQIKSFEEY